MLGIQWVCNHLRVQVILKTKNEHREAITKKGKEAQVWLCFGLLLPKKKKGKQWAEFNRAIELAEGRNIYLLGYGQPCNRVAY